MVFLLRRWNRRERGPPGRGPLWVSPYAVGTAGNLGLPSRGPISWEEMGERTPEGRGSSLWTPFSGGIGWGEAVLLMEYLACGPLSERPVTARPPAGRAGDVDRYPLGKGGEKPFRFPLVPPVNEPLLPPAQAGGRAMRRWSWRPQARPLPDGTTFPHSSHQRMGFQGEGTSFPLVFFPLFLPRNRAPPGRAKFLPVSTAQEKTHTGAGRPLPHSRKEVTTGSVTAQRMVLRKFTREAKVSSTP